MTPLPAATAKGPLVSAEARVAPLVVVHGGVDMEPTTETLTALGRAAESGAAALAKGCDALVAATEALAVLENDPAFNAGYGSVLTRAGTVETDGAIADGRTGRFAGVAAVPDLRHPAALARHLMVDGDTVLLVGTAAQAYGVARGLQPGELATTEQRAALEADDEGRSPFTGRAPMVAQRAPSETVGCIVVDPDSRVVVASSTGGLRGKRPGRVGDAAVPGAGYWADDRTGVLCSGSGEATLKAALAFRVADRATTTGVAEAAYWAVTTAAAGNATVAVLAVDAATREVAAVHNGASFPVVAHDGAGLRVAPSLDLRDAVR
jgi:beta-aspartyl-peptidase (threonine type)